MSTAGDGVTEYKPDPRHVLETGTESLVFRLMEAEGHRTIQRPISSRVSITIPTPENYGFGVDAARRVRQRADRLVHEWARKARGTGMSWLDLAEPLGIVRDPDIVYDDRAQRAFEEIAGTPYRPFDPRRVTWDCTDCGGTVTDLGTEGGGGPEEYERGHTDNCERHAIEIAAYRAQWDDVE